MHKSNFGYQLVAIIREALLWDGGMELKKAQEIAEKISNQVFYADWITVALPDGKGNTFVSEKGI